MNKYMSSAARKMISQRQEYLALVGGVNEKLAKPPIVFKNGSFQTADKDLIKRIESDPEFSKTEPLGSFVTGKDGRTRRVSIVPQPDVPRETKAEAKVSAAEAKVDAAKAEVEAAKAEAKAAAKAKADAAKADAK